MDRKQKKIHFYLDRSGIIKKTILLPNKNILIYKKKPKLLKNAN